MEPTTELKASFAEQQAVKSIYIAGPMRGYKYFNFPAFDTARDMLKMAGWCAISPADLDRSTGFDPWKLPEDYDWRDLNKIGFSIEDAIARDTQVLNAVHAIYMLDGWQNSRGARAELAIAEWRGIQVIYQTPLDGFASGVKSELLGSELRQIPFEGLDEIGKIFAEGAAKYGADNWKKGVGDIAYQNERCNHAIRHLMLWANGDRSENHLAKVAWFAVTQTWLEANQKKAAA